MKTQHDKLAKLIDSVGIVTGDVHQIFKTLCEYGILDEKKNSIRNISSLFGASRARGGVRVFKFDPDSGELTEKEDGKRLAKRGNWVVSKDSISVEEVIDFLSKGKPIPTPVAVQIKNTFARMQKKSYDLIEDAINQAYNAGVSDARKSQPKINAVPETGTQSPYIQLFACSPTGDSIPYHLIGRDISMAKDRVFICAPWVRDMAIISPAMASPVKNKLVIASNHPTAIDASMLPIFAQSRLGVLQVGGDSHESELMHSKFIVCDDVVWHGSANYTGNSRRNFEIVTRIDNAEFANELVKYVDQIIAHQSIKEVQDV